MTNVWLWRHPRPTGHEGRCIGRTDVPVDPRKARRLALHHPRTLTPLSFPLWAETVRGELSTEDWAQRVRRAAEQLQARHG